MESTNEEILLLKKECLKLKRENYLLNHFYKKLKVELLSLEYQDNQKTTK